MKSSKNRQIVIVIGAVVVLVVLGLAGAYFGGEASRERAALAEATPEGPPVESLHDCPWGEASCVLALGIERALQSRSVDAIMEFTEPRTYICPGAGTASPNPPTPLCDGVDDLESREGYPYLVRHVESLVVEKEFLRSAVGDFVERVDSDAEDEFGSGKLQLHAFACPERAVPFQNVGCARLAIIITAIVRNGDSNERELLVFWAVGNYRGRTLPVTEVWQGGFQPEEETILFETGGVLLDLGEVYIIDQSLRGDAPPQRR